MVDTALAIRMTTVLLEMLSTWWFADCHIIADSGSQRRTCAKCELLGWLDAPELVQSCLSGLVKDPEGREGRASTILCLESGGFTGIYKISSPRDRFL